MPWIGIRENIYTLFIHPKSSPAVYKNRNFDIMLSRLRYFYGTVYEKEGQ